MIQFPRIHELHKETQKDMRIPTDEKLWPASWKIVEFKEYPRFKSFSLPSPTLLNDSISSVLLSRQTKRVFRETETLSSAELSSLLFWSAGEKETQKDFNGNNSRFYPSGGARYPLEVYISFRGNGTIPQGVYHYNVKKNTLELLLGKNGDEMLRKIPSYPWMPKAALLVFISAVFGRTMGKYKERGYRFINLESGILLENFYLVSTAIGLSMCASGVINENLVENILDIDQETEGIMTQFVIGR